MSVLKGNKINQMLQMRQKGDYYLLHNCNCRSYKKQKGLP